MITIHFKTNQSKLITNLRSAFTQASMLGELLQNARRAQARHIDFRVDDDSITVSDDGIGIADLQNLISIADSGWDPELQARENAFGMGVLSTLYFAERLSVHSGSQAFEASTAMIIQGEAIEVQARPARTGTEIRLDGVKPPREIGSLIGWTESELRRLCEAFPVRVSFNGKDIPRRLARPALVWRETPAGRVLIDLAAGNQRWRCFLQGLPIGFHEYFTHQNIVHLRDDMLARLPDRQFLLNEEEDHLRIQAAIDMAYRQALIEAKRRMDGSEFVLRHGETCLSSENADLLNDVPFAPLRWFRNWSERPAGFGRWGESDHREGITTQATLQEIGVWCIESEGADTDQGDDDVDEGDDDLLAQCYLQARDAFLLCERRLDDDHWLMNIVRVISQQEIIVDHGTVLNMQANPPLADYPVELTLVDTLNLGLRGESTVYPVKAVRQGSVIYLTPQASRATRLISDYSVDERYDEDRESEDAQYLATFIAVGCSEDPGEVVRALLPDALRYEAQSKLAASTVRLIFDETGKLTSVTSDRIH
jgi:hypothetical protein